FPAQLRTEVVKNPKRTGCVMKSARVRQKILFNTAVFIHLIPSITVARDIQIFEIISGAEFGMQPVDVKLMNTECSQRVVVKIRNDRRRASPRRVVIDLHERLESKRCISTF